MKIGILAVQGDYEAHAQMLARMGVEYVYVRSPQDLEGVGGVILPGGESTTQLQFLREEGLKEALRKFAANGGAFFGTCAGAILLAREVHNPPQDSLGLADFTVTRNAYGRQLSSEVLQGASRLKDGLLEMVFIRAPQIENLGPGWEVLAERSGKPVLLHKGRLLIATFHPELTEDTTVHEYFLKLVRNGA
jgi:5'-phosphate synthase pdxT subunit